MIAEAQAVTVRFASRTLFEGLSFE
ncbi:MAG: hypothetical protein QOD70_1498, partial [Frankiales bacterium]|nr:hypothetical protein [Frankiales bacterium]